ncbi:MAG: 2Fe-2S iron-sulfur cluster binding domain-containing protein [Burkholderiales bacterium]|nr:2Fe-2S iron-sulfur cluster binding domain-containing protein [Burkholderiales bacterium]MDE2433655.1 2Fe-2S iron-sulfur cluster binding domain-containing protein [Burkholderiales bacterium]HET8695426.1 2Fe-2S iron-sulfur cluster-binding protein [Aquabacterium sp.]
MVTNPVVFQLRIEPQGWVCPVPAGVSIWKAARRAGIRLPSSCLNGTCRTCLCRLISGQVVYSIEWPGVSVDEREAGWILPCVARPISDVVIESPSALRELGIGGGG